MSDKIKKAVTDLGLKIVATKPEDQSCAMTAIYLPDGVQIANVLPKLASRGVIFAGGLHKEIATKYIRFGHMGVSVVSDPKLIRLTIKVLTISRHRRTQLGQISTRRLKP